MSRLRSAPALASLLATTLALVLAPAVSRAARFGVPTNLNPAGQVCAAAGTPSGCTAASADPPGWFVLERQNSGSANGDVVKQVRLFVEVTGTTLDVRVFDPGSADPTVPRGARDNGNPFAMRYRLYDPNGTLRAGVTISGDTASTENRLVRFACQDSGGTTAAFRTLDTAAGATNRVFGTGSNQCAPLAAGLYVFEASVQGTASVEGRNAFGVELVDSAGNPYNAYTIGNADDTVTPPSATDTSMVTGAVAGDRPTANVSGYAAFFPLVDRGCSVEAINFDLDANTAEGNGSVASLADTLGAATDLQRSNDDAVATTTVTVEPTGTTNLVSNNYGAYTLRNQLDEWATAQNHVDWRFADFRGSAAGSPANFPRRPTAPLRMYLPNGYSGCSESGCTLVAPTVPVLAASAVLLGGENPPLPGGAATRFAITATVANPGPGAITGVQVTVPIAAEAAFVAGTQAATIDGAAAACTDASTAAYRRCTFASVAAGAYASLGFEVDFQPTATGVRNLTGAPAAGSPPPDTTVWALYAPPSQSTTFPRQVTLGPICQLAVNAAPAADLALSFPTDSPDPVAAGATITYTFRLANNGPSAAPNVVATDVLPPGTGFVSVAAPVGWSCVSPPVGSGGSVRCALASLASGGTADFTVVARVASTVPNGTVLTNAVAATGGGSDAVPANDRLSMTTTVVSPAASADLAVTKTDTPDPVPAGQDLTYTITVANGGPATALAVTLADSVPASTTFRSITTPAGWSCTTPAVGGTGAVSCSLASLAAGQSSALALRVRVDLGATPGSTVTSTATVSGSVSDPSGANDSATATTTVDAANTCPTPGKDGAGGTLAGTINSYYPGTATAAAGTTSITLGARTGATATIAAGDLVLVVQMQDAAVNSTDTDAYGDGTAGDGEARGATAQNATGRFEYAVATTAVGAAGGTLTLSRPLLNTYTAAAPTAAQGRRSFQVVRVPQYTTATLGSSLTAGYWNGLTGGVLVLDVQGALALGGATVDVSGRGFRGGGAQQRAGGAGGSGTAYRSLATSNYHSSKGEGTAGTPRYVYDPAGLAVVDTAVEGYPNGSFARGAPGTAGGGGVDSNPSANDQNSGGGGGGNGGLGGRGGNAWNSNAAVGGFGGATAPGSASIATLGGGGGAGTRNNSAGDQSSGNAGGGIVLVRAGSLSGAGTIAADGLSANTADTTPANDGGGGGGAGGTVIVLAPGGGTAGLTVNARGGRGSDAWPTIGATSYPGERHGPGGGGGGGRVFLSGAPASATVTGGASGTTSTTQETFGASDGNPGTTSTSLVATQLPGIDSTGVCGASTASVVDLAVSVGGPPDPVDACGTASYVFTVANNGPDAAIDATASFPVPAGTTFQSLSAAPGWTCATPPAGGTGAVSCARASVPAGASAAFTLSLRVACTAAPGTLVRVTGSVGTASTDTVSANDAATTANVVGPAIQLLTRASVRGVRVDPSGLVEFATAWQQRTAGFRLYQSSDPSGRRGLVPLSDETIPAPRPDSQVPIVYSARTAPVVAPFVFVEEIERGGERRLMGPFAVGDPRQEALLARTERRLARAGAEPVVVGASARARLVARTRRAGSSQADDVLRRRPRPVEPASLKIETAGEGIAVVPRASLAEGGLPPGVRLSACRLTSRGRPVPFEVREENGPGEALVFRAEALETAYASRNVSVLTWKGRPPAMAVDLTSEADPPRPGFVRVGKPLLWVAGAPPGTDPWLWDQLVPGYGTWPYEWDPAVGDFDLPGWPDAASPAVSVRLRVQGMTAHRHVVSVTLNGESLGTLEVDGARPGWLDATASLLRAERNELRIDYRTADGDPDGYAYLDYVEVARPAGWSDPPVAVSVAPFDDRLPRAAAEYLVLTHPLFAGPAQKLAEAKRREGWRVAVADVANAYDRLSGGIPEAAAVRELVRRAAAGGRLRHVLLLGDDSFDPDDRAGYGGFAFVPSLLGWDGAFGRVASENRYADVDGDGSPDVSIGRLPARTAEQAEALVDKVERQQALLEPGLGRHLFAVDDPGREGFDFADEARTVAARLPRSAPQAWADLAAGVGPARERLFGALGEGAAFTHYFGHGGPQEWGDEGLLTVEDAAALPHTGTVVLTWACLSQFYQYLFGPSVNESLLLAPQGGAVAAFGPAGITDAGLQSLLFEPLYDELARGPVALGEAIRRAKAKALASDPRSARLVEGWNLLGDPSLVVSLRPTRGGPTRRR